jgi:hypothetical protein
MDLDPDPDSDSNPAIFVSDLQDFNKKFFYLSVFAFYFLKVHLHHIIKIKNFKSLKITKQLESVFFLLFLLDDRRIRIRSRIRISD